MAGFYICYDLDGFGPLGIIRYPKPLKAKPTTQRAQYPLIKEYGLNYIGLHIMI